MQLKSILGDEKCNFPKADRADRQLVLGARRKGHRATLFPEGRIVVR
jgi:hypothetical protein